MIDFDKYDPKCPECGWKLADDVYYQVKDKEVHELEYDVPTHSPIPKFPDLPVYPRYDSQDNIWTETHLCPTCGEEYCYDLPEEEVIVEDNKTLYMESLLCKVNKVTAYHRHGQPIPKKALDDLSNFQIEVEEYLEGKKR